MAEADAKVPEVRERFLAKYEGNILDDTYAESDVKMVKNDDAFIRCVIAAYKTGGDVKHCVETINDVLLFRAKWKLSALTEADLDREAFAKNGCFFHGVDKQGHKILHFRVCKQRKGHQVKEAKQIIAYFIEQHFKENKEEQIIFLFDFVDAGIGNMDLDITKFIVHCASTYFPHSVAYNLMFKMAPALEAIWKIIKGFLDKEQSKKTYFVTRKDITEYIDAEQLLPHMLEHEKKK